MTPKREMPPTSQILMTLQMPIVLFFAIQWLRGLASGFGGLALPAGA